MNIPSELLPLIVLLALATGWALGQYWRARWIRRNKARLRKEAKYILAEAEREGQAKIVDAELQAKGILLEERRQFEVLRRQAEEDLAKREKLIATLLEHLECEKRDQQRRKEKLDQEKAKLADQEAEIAGLRAQVQAHLEKLAGLSLEEARRELFKEAEEVARSEIQARAKMVRDEAHHNAERKAREIIVTVMERLSRSVVAEATVCSLTLPSQEMKGRIIGRDGRNVRAFEAVAGVDVLLDEESNSVTLSCHNPFRREVARQALEHLVADGRIQPSRIEEFVALAEKDLRAAALLRGMEAMQELGLSGIPDKLLELLGQLYFRTSYSQNVLRHSVEVGVIAGMIAAELGLDQEWQSKARRAGLLHDCGKALDESHKGPHALEGAGYLEGLSEAREVINAVAAHHGEVEDESILAPVLRVADALSGARPGARREDLAVYLHRLEGLEKLACSFKGVERAYAFQAGREIHVTVAPAEVGEGELKVLAGNIAAEIQKRFNYGGMVKVAVIRETKAVEMVRWSEENNVS